MLLLCNGSSYDALMMIRRRTEVVGDTTRQSPYYPLRRLLLVSITRRRTEVVADSTIYIYIYTYIYIYNIYSVSILSPEAPATSIGYQIVHYQISPELPALLSRYYSAPYAPKLRHKATKLRN